MDDRPTSGDERARWRTPGPDGGAPVTPADDRRPGGEPRREALPFGRRRRTAASALVAILVALCLGALFNASAMKKTALELPFGGERGFRLALVEPLADVSHWLFLDRPAELTASALGRPEPGPTGADEVAVVVASPTASAGARPAKKGDKPPPSPQESPLRTPYKGHPIHLYIAGDSMIGLPGMALTNLSIKTKLIKPLLDYHISSGLCRPDFFDWPAQLRHQTKDFFPGAVVVMFGANDNQAVRTSSGKIYQFGSDGWKKEYRKRVEDVIGLLFGARVRRVYWIGQPIMPSSSFNGQVKLLNQIYESVADKTFGVQYIDAYALLSKNGQYAQYLPAGASGEVQQVREQDGEHLTYAGGLIVAHAVLDAIKKEWFPRKGAGTPSPSASPKPKQSAPPAP
jgi:hypothetical protein